MFIESNNIKIMFTFVTNLLMATWIQRIEFLTFYSCFINLHTVNSDKKAFTNKKVCYFPFICDIRPT